MNYVVVLLSVSCLPACLPACSMHSYLVSLDVPNVTCKGSVSPYLNAQVSQVSRENRLGTLAAWKEREREEKGKHNYSSTYVVD